MKRQTVLVAALVVVSTFGTILVTNALGLWTTESNRVPRLLNASGGEPIYDPGDIRGSYTFADVAASFSVSVETLATAFGFADAEDPSVIRASELEAIFGEVAALGEMEIGTDSIRLFVALWENLPHEPEETTALPARAMQLLQSHEGTDPDRLALYQDRVVAQSVLTGAAGSTEAGTGSGEPIDDHEEREDDTTIRGRTSFAELYTWGLTQDEVAAVLGTDPPARGVLIRDFVMEQGLEFGTIRDELQVLVDERTGE